MRSTAALAILGLLSSVASAQPGGAPPPPPPPVYAPPPPPPTYGGYPQYPQQPVGLTADEQRILARGEIAAGEHAGGAVLSFFIGFGTGQAVQGRWAEKGWIFTVGELASFAAMLFSLTSTAENCNDGYCDDDNMGLFVVGMFGYAGFRVWGFVDSIAGPASHNRRLREIQMRMGYPRPYYSVAPFVAPTRDGGGGVAGVTLRF
jgi:hypothetical protein